MSDRCRVAVLISGRGSNLQALLQAHGERQLNADIVGVLSNKADAGGLVYAADANIEAAVVSHLDFPTREQFDAQLLATLTRWRVDLVVLSGFMRILGDDLVNQFAGRMINQHPSLLPDYPGLNTHQRVLDDGVRQHGASVHYVIPALDAGPVLMQAEIEVHDDDNADTLASRILPLEHKMIVAAVNLIGGGDVQMGSDGLIYHCGIALEAPFKLSNLSPAKGQVETESNSE